MIAQKNTRERMLTDVERALLADSSAQDPAGYPITKAAGKWSWQFRTLSAPRMYDTRKEAVQQFEAFLGILRDAQRIEGEQKYNATSGE